MNAETTAAKKPSRPAAAIVADMEKERGALRASFGSLREELGEAVDTGRRRAVETGRKAIVVAPVAAALVASMAAARSLLRRRR